MYVKANNTFNHGGIIAMNYDDHREVEDELAKKLIKLGLVSEHTVSYKKIKVKKDESIDKTTNDS